jgi:hypothetical protein
MLACTAVVLDRTLASISAPCSVKTQGNLRRPPHLDVAYCDIKLLHSLDVN